MIADNLEPNKICNLRQYVVTAATPTANQVGRSG
jgi:hypothetical protein